MLGLAFFTLTAALLLVIYRRDVERAFWVGFATFGWVYLLLLVYGWGVENVNSPVRTSSMVTDRISRASYDWLFAEATTQGYGGGYFVGGDGGIGGSNMGSGYGSSLPPVPSSAGLPPGYGTMVARPTPAFAPPTKKDFTNVAHGIWAILLAAIGGQLARLIYRTQPRHTSATT